MSESIITGAQFSSYDEFVHVLRAFELKNNVLFSIGDSRTLEKAKKAVPKLFEKTDPAIRYYLVTFKCCRAGKYKSRGNGIRPNQKTQKTFCPAVIKLKVNKRGKLEIYELNNEHSHENDLTAVRRSPKQWHKNVKTKESRHRKANKENATPQEELAFSEHEKYKNAFKIAYELASCIVEFSGNDYFRRLKQLERLKNTWLSGHHVQITEQSDVEEKEMGESEFEEGEAEEFDLEKNDGEDEISYAKVKLLPSACDRQGQNSELLRELEDNSLLRLKEREYPKECEIAKEVFLCELKDNSLLVKKREHPKECENTREVFSCELEDNSLRVKKREHPKECENAQEVLPDKRFRKGPIAFAELLPREKEKRILSWLVPLSDETLNEILEGTRKIYKASITVRPEEMPNCTLDENVCINAVQKYFSFDAWLLVKNLLNVKKQKLKWFCRVCTLVIDDGNESQQSICCDSCLDWIHLKCATLKTFPKNKQWFCSNC